MGGFFKERLRELGGLDTICDLAAGCLRNIRVKQYHHLEFWFLTWENEETMFKSEVFILQCKY